MQRAWAVLFAAMATCAPMPARAATCPFNIPVVTLPPHQAGGFSWGNPIRPLGDACVEAVAVDPTDDQRLYVGGTNGLYQTTDGGQTWTHPITGGIVHGALRIVTMPGSPQLVYAGAGTKLWLSRDRGKNWNVVRKFAQTVRSVLVAPGGLLFVGLAWSNHVQPSGVWASNLGGGGAVFHAFGPGQTGLIVWTLARDPIGGALYAGTEIYDHPQPYKPPFFRSTDSGVTWKNVAGTLPWHVVDAAVRPNDGFVYALTEGAGLYGSANQAQSWHALFNGVGPTGVLLMDPQTPTRVFGGRVKAGTLNGGAFLSLDGGATFTPIGLTGASVAGLALNGPRTRLFAALYASGVYVSPVP